ncbi:hypothetical protein GCM10027567_16780 [Spongiibacter taiwanensis]
MSYDWLAPALADAPSKPAFGADNASQFSLSPGLVTRPYMDVGQGYWPDIVVYSVSDRSRYDHSNSDPSQDLLRF